ncbi:uncharacterized protein LOC124159154 [Ischnura elegans]|uniref:uncharacterized protein LOC124159154 n=1 Tax=Ischnura elegans TaxID=197161 RepID=UPI001ED8B102|nr:uncharacterized protein LOC124159154 [Ischnura elegans]
MASHSEKNLLDEITYLSRLIGQHKNGRTSSNRKWENLSQKPPYQRSHKAISHPYFSASKAGVVQPYRIINTVDKSNMRLVPKHQEKKNHSVYISPKSKIGLLPKEPLGSNSAGGASSCLKKTNVHINPHFSQNKSTKSNKVLVNHNLNANCVQQESVTRSNQTVTASTSPAAKLKVLLNPKFCELMPDNSPHTQLRTLMNNKVHVNRKLVEKVLKEKSETEVKCAKNLVSPLNKIAEFPVKNSYQTVPSSTTGYAGCDAYSKHQMPNGRVGLNVTQTNWRKSEFLTLGKRKLVRVNHKVNIGNEAKIKTRTKALRSNLSLIRNRPLSIRSPSLAVKKAKVIASKYKLVKNNIATQSGSKQGTNKYKIDRRSPATKLLNQTYNKVGESYRLSALRLKKSCPLRSTPKHGSQSLVSARSNSGNMVWRRTWSLQAKEFKTTNTKLYRIGNSPALKKKNDSGKNSTTFNKALVRIGGVLYKSSRNKLTISQGGSSTTTVTKINSQVSLKKNGKNFAKGQVLCIRGQKFVMDTKGKTLRRLSSSDSLVKGSLNVPTQYSFRRVDIGGVTFIKKSSNVLMRTNTHKARSLLSYAKQRSIATLRNKLKKNNQPCIIYRKFGRCFRFEKGTCPCVHDRKHVAVCKRFLLGKCYADKCLLSHDVVPEKMPTCKYFLEGCCNRQNCPYLHVKVNSKADICISFLQGYCANGKKCKKRHVCLCPEFEKTGKCVKGKNCLYPHEEVRLKNNSLKGGKVIVKTSKSSLGSKKWSQQVSRAAIKPSAKNEHTRYYLAPKEIVTDLKNEVSSNDEKTSLRELNDSIIPCKHEVSSSCGSVPVVGNGDLKLSTSKRILHRDKIGSLPSFIPL